MKRNRMLPSMFMGFADDAEETPVEATEERPAAEEIVDEPAGTEEVL